MRHYVGVVFAGGEGSRLKSVTKDIIPKHLLKIQDGQHLSSTMLGRLVHQFQSQPEIKRIVVMTGKKHDVTAKWLNGFNRSLKVPVKLVNQPNAGDWKENFQALIGDLSPKENGVIVPGDMIILQGNIRKVLNAHTADKPFLHVVLGPDKLHKTALPVSVWATNKKGLETAIDHNPESWRQMISLLSKIKEIRASPGSPVLNVNTPSDLKKAREILSRKKRL